MVQVFDPLEFINKSVQPTGTPDVNAEFLNDFQQSLVDTQVEVNDLGVDKIDKIDVGVKSVNVAKYGLSGIGAINSAIAAAIASGARRIYIPPGTFDIAAPIKPSAGQIEFIGESRSTSIIRQTAANTPVFQFENSTVGDKHSITVKALTLKNSNLPTTGTTQQYGIQFRSDAAGTFADGNGFYLCRFEDLRIDNTYVAIGPYVSGAGSCPLWSNVYRDLVIFDCIHNAIKLRGGAAGQPADVIENVNILNYTIGAITDSYALDAGGVNGLVINGLNIEDWRNRLISIDGGNTASLNGIRTERIVIDDNGFPSLIALANGDFALDSVDYDLVFKHTSGYARLLFASGGAQVSVRAIQGRRNPVGSTTAWAVQLLGGDSSSTIVAEDVRTDANVSKYLTSAWGPDLYARKSVDGLPPPVDVLPAASVTYRGRMFRIDGGAGVEDKVYRCDKSSADTYSWVPVSNAWTDISGKPSTFPPSSHNHAASEITSGILLPARLGSGTPDGTKALFGDGAWKVPTANDILSSLVNAEVSITGATTLTGTAFGKMHVLTGASSYVVGLPAASGNAGKIIGFRVPSSVAVTVGFTLDPNAAETIDGATTRVLNTEEAVILQCDGANWNRIARKNVTLTLLNIAYNTDVYNASAVAGGAWFDFVPNQSFTVFDPASLIEVRVLGNAYSSTTTVYQTAAFLDSAGANTKKNLSGGGAGLINLTGSFVTGLAPGAHTIRIMGMANGAGTVYFLPNTQPNIYACQIHILEKKQ